MTTGKKVKRRLQKVMDQESQKDCPEPILQKQYTNWVVVKTMFLQKKQRIISVTRMQFNLPQQSSSFHRRQNYPIAQLATCAARVPYSPKIPTPTLAYMIMFTSLAPSPIARVSLPMFFTKRTIQAFWPGVTLQKTTDLTLVITNYKLYSFQTKDMAEPSMTGLLQRQPGTPSTMSLAKAQRSVLFLIRIPLSMSLQERAMFYAVSNLSPVSMINLIPPLRNEKIVSATQSCNLSQIPVAPTKVSPLSISPQDMPSMLQLSASVLCANQRHLKPVLDISSVFYRTSQRYFWLGARIFYMLLSAPFTNIRTVPQVFRTTVILFRSESNQISFRISQERTLLRYYTFMTLFQQEMNLNPKSYAAFRRATSSGEGPSNPPLSDGTHQWQVATMVKISSMSFLFVCLEDPSSPSLRSQFKVLESKFSCVLLLSEKREEKRSQLILSYMGGSYKLSPYSSLPMTMFLNSILLQVSVPVLSVRIYSTCPNSSLILTVLHSSLRLLNGQYISQSLDMKQPWKTLTNSRETMRLMGMKVLQRMKQDAKEMPARLRQEGFPVKMSCQKAYVSLQPQQEQPALMRQQMVSRERMMRMKRFTLFQMLLVLVKGLLPFIIIAVSFPVYMTIPNTQSVFLSLHPRKTMFFLLIFSLMFIYLYLKENSPSNDSISAVGLMHLISPVNIPSENSWVVLQQVCRGANESLGFKFFSPSRDEVSTQDIPELADETSTITSAGMTSSFDILMQLPCRTSFHCTSSKSPSVRL